MLVTKDFKFKFKEKYNVKYIIKLVINNAYAINF